MKAPPDKIHSILRKITEDLKNSQLTIEELKVETILIIENSSIDEDDKKVMIEKIRRKSPKVELQRYLYNCILKYEGEGVIK